jgi:hypothetical protein
MALVVAEIGCAGQIVMPSAIASAFIERDPDWVGC